MLSLKPVHVIATLLGLFSLLSLLAARRCLANCVGRMEYETILFALIAAHLTLLIGWLAVSRWKAIPALLIFAYYFVLVGNNVPGGLNATGGFAISVFLLTLFVATAMKQLCVPGILHLRKSPPAHAAMRVTLLDMMLWTAVAAGLVLMIQHTLPTGADAVRRGVMAGVFAAVIATLHLQFICFRIFLPANFQPSLTALLCSMPVFAFVIYLAVFQQDPLVWQPLLFEMVFSLILLLSVACLAGSQPKIQTREAIAEASS